MSDSSSSFAWFRSTWFHYVGTASVTAALTAWVLQLWKASLHVPFTYWGDALAVGAHFKTVIETGWYENQSRLSAPAGQVYHDFPTADNLHLVAARILSFFTQDWALAVNLYFIAGFVLASISALWFLRRVGVSAWVAFALSVLYALAPYHFTRGQGHLWLSSYYAVPLGAALLLAVLRGERLWSLGKGGRLRRIVLSPAARTFVFLGLLAASSSYYAVFFLVMLAVAGIAVWIRDRVWRNFVGAVSLGVVTVGWMLVNMLPDLIYSWRNGPNHEGLVRSSGEAEVYALKFSQLILPWAGHRIDIIAEMRQRYDHEYVVLREPPALGAVAAFGFVAAFIIVGYAAVARMRAVQSAAQSLSVQSQPAQSGPSTPSAASGTAATTMHATLAALSFLVLVAFMFASVGSVSTLISFLTPNLRGWNRMSIDIAILSLGITGVIVDAVIVWLRGLTRARWAKVALPAVVATVILAGGVFDQTPGNAGRDYAANDQAFASNHLFFAGIEASLPEGAQVLIQPYVPFPEGNAESGLLAASQLIPYLHTQEIRWTAGGINGRPEADWPGTLRFYPDESIAALAVLSGSQAILVDREAYVDRGAAIEAELQATPGVGEPTVSGSGRFAFYSLDGVAAKNGIEASEDLLGRITTPVIAYLDRASPPVAADDLLGRIAAPVIAYLDKASPAVPADDLLAPVNELAWSGAAMTLVNDSASGRTVELAITVVTDSTTCPVSLLLPDGTRVEGTASGTPTTLSATVEVPPGGVKVTLERCGLDPTQPVAVAFSVPRTTDVVVSKSLATLALGES